MSETLVLSVGLDPLSLYTREQVLRSSGYIVISVMSIKEAFHRFRNGDFDLMILCRTLPPKDRERLICLIRASGSRIPVACIAGTPHEQSAFADATLEENSVAFIAGIKRLLAKYAARIPAGISTSSDNHRDDDAPDSFPAHSSQGETQRSETYTHWDVANRRGHAAERLLAN
jgi:CheY-like chemotaxis protein